MWCSLSWWCISSKCLYLRVIVESTIVIFYLLCIRYIPVLINASVLVYSHYKNGTIKLYNIFTILVIAVLFYYASRRMNIFHVVLFTEEVIYWRNNNQRESVVIVRTAHSCIILYWCKEINAVTLIYWSHDPAPKNHMTQIWLPWRFVLRWLFSQLLQALEAMQQRQIQRQSWFGMAWVSYCYSYKKIVLIDVFLPNLACISMKWLQYNKKKNNIFFKNNW